MSFDLWYFIVVFIFQSVPAQAVLLFYYSQTLRKELYLEPSLMHVMLLIVMYNTVSEKAVAPHSSTLAWKIHGRRSLVGCSPWGRKELDTTERLHFYFSLSFIGEGNGNPIQCSCLENPRDGGAWWAAVYGVAQSQTWLKRLSSSSRHLLADFATLA